MNIVPELCVGGGNEIFFACVVLGVCTSTCTPACVMRMSKERYDCLTNVGVSHLESPIGFLEWGDDVDSIFSNKKIKRSDWTRIGNRIGK